MMRYSDLKTAFRSVNKILPENRKFPTGIEIRPGIKLSVSPRMFYDNRYDAFVDHRFPI